MRLHFFHAGGEGKAGSSTKHVVRENQAHWRFLQNCEGFRARRCCKNQIAFSLENSFAQPEIGFIVFYTQDGGLAGSSTRRTFASHFTCHGTSKDSQTGEVKTGQYCSRFALKS